MYDKKAYKLEAKPFSIGGQAQLFHGRAKADDSPIVFKRRLAGSLAARHRLAREVSVQRKLSAVTPHVMPVLDWDATHHEWYVMPRGLRCMDQLQPPLSDDQLLQIVHAVLNALEHADKLGHPHRDLKPANIIELETEEGGTRWVAADWGVTRRPLGQTTSPLTVVGAMIGTIGYAAPESYIDGHKLGLTADLYSLGQVIGWALTGQHPIQNVAPQNVTGPWRHIVKRLTQLDPGKRFQTCAEVSRAIQVGFDEGTVRSATIEELAAKGDDRSAAAACLKALEVDDDVDLLLDTIAPLDNATKLLVTKHPEEALALVRAMCEAMKTFGTRDFNYANTPLYFMHRIAAAAAVEGNIDLLEDVCDLLFEKEAGWDRYRQRDITLDWLRTLRGAAAHAVSQVLLRTPQMRKYLRTSHIDGEIGAALRSLA
jgi:serine/threonine protein kinase